MNNATLPPISNLATWTDVVSVFDDGEPVNISAATDITLKLRDPSTGSEVLSGSLGDEIALINDTDDNSFSFRFLNTVMSGVDPNTYELGVLLTISGDVVELILGRQPVLRGL